MNNIALVTGATRGIGLETARQLSAKGLTVLLGARTLADGERIAAEMRAGGNDVHALRLDLQDEATILEAAKWIDTTFGRLDILVNNAGVMLDGDGFPSLANTEVIRKVLDINFVATVSVTQALLPLLRKSESGRIVNVSSRVGSLWWNGDPDNPVPDNKWIGYAASKAALNMFTVNLAYELRGTKIKVNSICPGYVRTEMNKGGGFLTVEEGARPSVNLALIDETGPSGLFFGDGESIRW